MYFPKTADAVCPGTKKRLSVTRKLLRRMRLTITFLLAICLQAMATDGYTQKVSLSEKNAKIEKVFAAIEKQTNFSFVYSKPILQNARPVTVELKEVNLEDALAQIFSSQPLTYRIFNGNMIAVRSKDETVAVIEIKPPVPAEIMVKVLTEDGAPLAGATVIIKRTGRGTQTNVQGEGLLKEIREDDIILVSYTGYETGSQKVTNDPTLTFFLKVANDELDQVVMQAYGKTSKRLNTGSIAKVTASEISKQSIVNPLQALQGKVPGLVVTQTSGYASAPFKVEIRGRTPIDYSLNGEPLYIVDGVPFTMRDNYGAGGISGFIQTGFVGPAYGQSPFFSINPYDIESIEVLKDADATAIYGSRGANGVILITTKKGKPGKPKLDINISQGISKVSRKWNLLNTQEYLAMRREAFVNDGITPDILNAYDLLEWDTTRYTDWQKLLFGGTGKSTIAQLNLSGGNDQTNFRMGASYNRVTNVLTASGADQRAALQVNINQKSFNQKLAISLTGSYSYAQSDMVEYLSNTITLPPNAPSIYDEAGKLNWEGWEPESYRFPFSSLLQPYSAKTNYLNSNMIINYSIAKGLNLSTNLGFGTANVDQVKIYPIASQNPLSSPAGYSQFGANKVTNWIIEPQLEYTNIIGIGKINVLIGGTLQSNKTNGLSYLASGYTSDALLKSQSAASVYTNFENNFSHYKYVALFSRINYNLHNKYILNLTARRDGSSRFGPGKQFGNFWAIGAAWIFSDENYIKKNLSFLSFGKIRGSYGITGSDQVRDYAYLSRWQPINGPINSYYQGMSGLQPTQHANPDYSWQVNRKLEIAMDLGFLNDNLLVSVAWYNNRCDNQLVEFPLPLITGFSAVTNNSPALVENSGWELTVNTKIIEQKNVEWSVNFNAAINKNRLISFPNFDQSSYRFIYEIGQPLNIRKSLHFLGVDPITGLYSFEDKDKDGIIEPNIVGSDGDLYIYKLNPVIAGLGTNFRFHELQLGANFQMVKQKGISGGAVLPSFPGELFANQPAIVLERWQKAGDKANFAKFTTAPYLAPANSYYNLLSSDAVVGSDASYIRLQNLFLSYSLPNKFFGNKSNITRWTIYLGAQNLFIITDYEGVDPETQNFGGLPSLKNYNLGLTLLF